MAICGSSPISPASTIRVLFAVAELQVRLAQLIIRRSPPTSISWYAKIGRPSAPITIELSFPVTPASNVCEVLVAHVISKHRKKSAAAPLYSIEITGNPSLPMAIVRPLVPVISILVSASVVEQSKLLQCTALVPLSS